MTERLHFDFSLSCIGEGNGNPRQCSCLENPRDWGAWWAAVYGVTQSRTRLKRLSSSSRLTLLQPYDSRNDFAYTRGPGYSDIIVKFLSFAIEQVCVDVYFYRVHFCKASLATNNTLIEICYFVMLKLATRLYSCPYNLKDKIFCLLNMNLGLLF